MIPDIPKPVHRLFTDRHLNETRHALSNILSELTGLYRESGTDPDSIAERIRLYQEDIKNLTVQKNSKDKNTDTRIYQSLNSIESYLNYLKKDPYSATAYRILQKLEQEVRKITISYGKDNAAVLIPVTYTTLKKTESIQKDLDSFFLSVITKSEENTEKINHLIRKYRNNPPVTMEQLRIIYKTNKSGLWNVTATNFCKTIYARQINISSPEDILKCHPSQAYPIHIIAIECLKKETEEKLNTVSAKVSAYLNDKIRQYEAFLIKAYKAQELPEKREGQDSGMSI